MTHRNGAGLPQGGLCGTTLGKHYVPTAAQNCSVDRAIAAWSAVWSMVPWRGEKKNPGMKGNVSVRLQFPFTATQLQEKQNGRRKCTPFRKRLHVYSLRASIMGTKERKRLRNVLSIDT